jgi:hypothetical protein
VTALIPFRPEHLDAIRPRALSPAQLEFFRRSYRPRGPAWTGVAAGRVIGCGGVVVTGDMGTAWAILSHPVPTAAAHRSALRALDEACAMQGLRRIEAAALADWPGACRWLERLGFQPMEIEGQYRRYVRWVPDRRSPP